MLMLGHFKWFIKTKVYFCLTSTRKFLTLSKRGGVSLHESDFWHTKNVYKKRNFFLLLVIGRLPFTELSTLHWYHNIASDCWSHSKIRHLIMDGITLGHPWCKRMQLHPKIRCNCVMCRWQASIREAILCQIGCFFTHCVNDPWPPPPRFYTIMLRIFLRNCWKVRKHLLQHKLTK